MPSLFPCSPVTREFVNGRKRKPRYKNKKKCKTNRMVSTKQTFHKERSFASNRFVFSKFLFQFKNPLQRVDLMYQVPKCPCSSIL